MKKRNTVLKKYLLSVTLAVFCITISFSQDLTVSNTGSKILKDGNPITLRGVNFGNWLVWEGYMMNLDQDGIKSHSQIRAGIKNLLNNSETRITNFENNWRNNYITNQDFARAKTLGYNVIRIPFHYNMFWNDATGTLKNDGFTWLDKAVDWASANNIYVIFCLHAAPGYQNPEHHSDNPGTSVNFWDANWNNVNIAKDVWRHIANRYKNYSGNEWLAGYDLLNEPVLDSNKSRLKQAYKEMTTSIRSVDSKHLIFAQGNYYGSDFYDMLEKWDSKLVFSNHYYGLQGESDPNPDLTLIKNQASNLNIPLFAGEYGENTMDWINAARTDYDSQNVGWAFWAWKRQQTDRSIFSFNTTNRWNRITTYLKTGANKPSLWQTEAGLSQIVNKVKLVNTDFINGLQDKLIPPKPINQYVWLKNSNKYVTSNNGVGPVAANRNSIGGWEKFQVIDAGDDKIALKGNNNKYVNSQNGNAALTCNSNSVGGWEAFEWVDINGEIALKGFNGKFVSSEGGAATGMNSNRETVSGWEAFSWGVTSARLINSLDIKIEKEPNTVLVYPNPASNVLHFNISTTASDADKVYTIEIYNAIGVNVFRQKNNTNTIDVSQLQTGSYILNIMDGDTKIHSKLFIKD